MSLTLRSVEWEGRVVGNHVWCRGGSVDTQVCVRVRVCVCVSVCVGCVDCSPTPVDPPGVLLDLG